MRNCHYFYQLTMSQTESEFIKERYIRHGLVPEEVEDGNNVRDFYRRKYPGELEQIEMLLSKLTQFRAFMESKNYDHRMKTAFKLTIVDCLYQLLVHRETQNGELTALHSTIAKVRTYFPSITQRTPSYQELCWKHAMKKSAKEVPTSTGALECYYLALLRAFMNSFENNLQKIDHYGNLIDKFYYIHAVEIPCQDMLDEIQPIDQFFNNGGNMPQLIPRFRALRLLIDQYVAPKYFGYNFLSEAIFIQHSSETKLYAFTETNQKIAYQSVHWLTIRTFIESYLQNPAGDKDLSTSLRDLALYLREALLSIIHLADDNTQKKIPAVPRKILKIIQKNLLNLSAVQLRSEINRLQGESFKSLPVSIQQKTVFNILFTVGEHAKMQRAWEFTADFNTPLVKIRDKVVLHFNRKGYPKQLNVLQLVRQKMKEEDLQVILNALGSIDFNENGYLSIGNDQLSEMKKLFFPRVVQTCINNPILDRLNNILQSYKELHKQRDERNKDILKKNKNAVMKCIKVHKNLDKYKGIIRALIDQFEPNWVPIRLFWEIFWGRAVSKKVFL